MNNAENSLFGSSVRSYKNIPANYSNRPNLVKYLHTQEKLPSQQPNKDPQTPLIIRNKSYDTFNSKIMDRPSNDKKITSHQHFYQSINNSTPHKYANEVGSLQSQITRLMANQLSMRTEKQLLQKQMKRLKEEINYLNEKCFNLQNKNEKLFQNQSRIAILQRQYNAVLGEFQQYKSKCVTSHHTTQNYQPQTVQTQYYRLKDHQIDPNKFNSKVSPKVSWKKASAVATSPIYKLETNRKYSGNHKLQDLSLIESKIDRLREDYISQRQSQYQIVNDQVKTVDLKDKQKSKEYQTNIRALELQIKELRLKNITLYQKAEEYEQQKIKLMEKTKEQNYQRAKLMSENKSKEDQLRNELQRLKIEMEDTKIKIIELNQQIVEKDELIKLLKIEKLQVEQKVVKLNENMETQWMAKESNNNKIVNELKQSLLKSEEQLCKLKQRCALMAKRQQQLQIENKLFQHELQQKRQLISSLEKGKEDNLDKLILLEDESVLSKTENKNERRQIQREDNCKYIQTEFYANLQTIHQPTQNKTESQLAILKQTYDKLLLQHTLWGQQLNQMKKQHQLINNNNMKLAQLYELQRMKNGQLMKLNQEWRMIEARIKKMKHIDSTVDHLWQIKEVQYQNINQILWRVNRN